MKKVKIGIASFVILALGVVTTMAWFGATTLVKRPIAERYDFCSGKAIFCVPTLLGELNLDDVKVEVALTSFDGTPLKGYYFPSQNGAAVIVQHGYGGHIGTVLRVAKMLYQQGFGVVTMDLRAHGRSGGELVTFGRDEAKDMQVVFDFLISQEEIDKDKIGLFGWSLGGATVLLHGAANNDVKAVVADSPFDAINYENMHEFTDLVWPLPALLQFFPASKVVLILLRKRLSTT